MYADIIILTTGADYVKGYRMIRKQCGFHKFTVKETDFDNVLKMSKVYCKLSTAERRLEDMRMLYGYIRVSSKDQNEERQIVALQKFGVDTKRIYIDKQSGKDFERPQYQRMIKKLRSDDTLVITSIDRLGRNYDEILMQWRTITKQKNAEIVVLDMPLLDTRQSRDLTGTLIADIVLQLLSYVAQTEREFTRQRQKEGIAVAKAKGGRFGRIPMERPPGYQAMLLKWRNGEISARAASKQLGITHKTFLRWANGENIG
jgi:DNA invertase Pin-like site-specific DNA recombinase